MQNNTLIPAAIIIAGALIAGSVFISNKDSTPKVAPRPTLSTLAKDAGVKDVKEFEACVQEGRFASEVQEEYAEVTNLGAQGTPHNFILGPNGHIVLVPGAQPYSTVSSVIDILLEGGDVATLIDSTFPENTGVRVVTTDVPKASIDNDHIRGNSDARVVIVEYSDIDCPFCANFHDTLTRITSTYPQEQVAWVYRDFPLDSLHPHARIKAESAECVAEIAGEEAYWNYLDSLFLTSNEVVNL